MALELQDRMLRSYETVVRAAQKATTDQQRVRLLLRLTGYELVARAVFTPDGRVRPDLDRVLHRQLEAFIPANTDNPVVPTALLVNLQARAPPKVPTHRPGPKEAVRAARARLMQRTDHALVFVRPDGELRDSVAEVEAAFRQHNP